MINTHFILPMNSYAALLFSRIIELQHFHKEDKWIPVGDCNYQKCSQQYFHPVCSCRPCHPSSQGKGSLPSLYLGTLGWNVLEMMWCDF